ncbi:prepilin-type N-terminal cleavage/methylation domain-containing protein [Neorhodopirellula lusitana]|uniref:Prepilin-type N-terminal cleavage/methylation domain-containing protein n=1 Tax=Neorhodopirellula lusitana TaxID=445327 RepID=A0ABY1Q3W8_9BACT|nr:type II secretion system protein [Neorhodopirellula lusitana]SMP58615.1 prepilin-type N-terminal cleavage/methylation domain-containing protein [Neorhodopirellula lusitana]
MIGTNANLLSEYHCLAIGRRRKHGSSGFTLIELMVVLSLVSTLLGGAIGLIAVVRQSESQAKLNLENRQGIRRFADDVRRDVALARRIEVDAKGQEKKMVIVRQADSPRIEYQAGPGSQIHRVVINESQEPLGQDSYLIGTNATIDVELLDETNSVRWTITEKDGGAPPIAILAVRREKK